MRRSKSRARVSAFVLFVGLCLFTSTTASADVYLILDGLCGMRAHYLRGLATKLECEGHEVIYRPWWRWRSAVRAATAADQPVYIIGYSLGGSRALKTAERLDVIRLELVDPFRLGRPRSIPKGVDTIVYRAGKRSLINSSPIIGPHEEIVLPAKHIEMWQFFGNKTNCD